MPDSDGTPRDDYPNLVQRAVSRYMGGQLLFSLIMGTTAGVALYMFGVLGIFPDGEKYAVVFGVFFGVMELIPYIGPILGALPPMLVALFTNPISALWVALLFVGLQQLEGHVVAPQVFGHTLRINPLLVIFALLLGLHVYGIVGALVALPLLSVLRETAVYLSRHLTSSRGIARARAAVSAALELPILSVRASTSASASCRRCAASASSATRGSSWRWSGRTARARRPCCRSSPGSSGRAPAACRPGLTGARSGGRRSSRRSTRSCRSPRT